MSGMPSGRPVSPTRRSPIGIYKVTVRSQMPGWRSWRGESRAAWPRSTAPSRIYIETLPP